MFEFALNNRFTAEIFSAKYTDGDGQVEYFFPIAESWISIVKFGKATAIIHRNDVRRPYFNSESRRRYTNILLHHQMIYPSKRENMTRSLISEENKPYYVFFLSSLVQIRKHKKWWQDLLIKKKKTISVVTEKVENIHAATLNSSKLIHDISNTSSWTSSVIFCTDVTSGKFLLTKNRWESTWGETVANYMT